MNRLLLLLFLFGVSLPAAAQIELEPVVTRPNVTLLNPPPLSTAMDYEAAQRHSLIWHDPQRRLPLRRLDTLHIVNINVGFDAVSDSLSGGEAFRQMLRNYTT
ncbi:MAG: hypothetical protein AAFO94_08915, partial [Bacteroidota bacterium]